MEAIKIPAPSLRYHGGKYRLSPWIIGHFPPHVTYGELYGGAMGVLLQKPRSPREIYNELDSNVSEIFEVLQDPQMAKRLQELLELTPYSRFEYEKAYLPADDIIERARRTLVRSYFCFASSGANRQRRSGLRRPSYKWKWKTVINDWLGWQKALPHVIDRVKGVFIESRPALQVIPDYDDPDTLYYVDPPYLPDVRFDANQYRHEMTKEDHEELADALNNSKSMVAISGYHSELYDKWYKDWETDETESRINSGTGGGDKKIEVLWMNKKLIAAKENYGNLPLFK